MRRIKDRFPTDQDDQNDQFLEFSSPSVGQRFMFQEYWVDLLGGLLPGTLFSVGATLALIPTFILLINVISGNFSISFSSLLNEFLKAAANTPNMIWVSLALALLSLAYILGHMFYRQDPKAPNQASVALLTKEVEERLMKERDLTKADEIPEEMLADRLKVELACPSKNNCEYPFPNLAEYLEQRGLGFLLCFVLWNGKPNFRTKNYINILKVRLRFYFPNRCATIIRNEAHIRLASSTWYVGWGLHWCCIIATFGLMTSIVFCLGYSLWLQSYFGLLEISYIDILNLIAKHLTIVLIILVVWLGSKYVRNKVERFLHYQRLREVVHVLDTAWVAFQFNPSILNPPFSKFNSEEEV